MQKLLARLVKPIVVPVFHWLWYGAADTWKANTFLGFSVLQFPLDLQLYQELVYREKPTFILQTGVCGGGSVMFFASLLDLIGAPPSALVIGVDIILREDAKQLSHPRIRLIEGDAVGAKVLQEIRSILPKGRGLVILDSDHSERHVAAELKAYREFVQVGGYLVVEDTNVNGHPVFRSHGPGPFEAAAKFLEQDKNFVKDDNIWKRNMISFHQWLKRVS